MASRMTQMLLVVVSALTLAIGALGVTGGLGSSWATAEVSATASAGNGGVATATDAEGDASLHHGAPGWIPGVASAATGGDADSGG